MDAADLESAVAAVERAAEACLTGAAEAGPGNDAALVSQLDVLQGAGVTVEVLSATGVGKRLKKVQKQLDAGGKSTADAAAAAKRVVDTWSERIAHALAAEGAHADGDDGGRAAKRHKAEEPLGPQEPPVAALPVVKRPPPKLDNEARLKHRELLVAALRVAESEGVQGDPEWVGAKVEEALFAKYKPTSKAEEPLYERTGGGSSKDYKNKFRQLSFNLKDGNNPDLRRSVLLGEVTPEELLDLSPEELGSSARRQDNLKIRERAMWECERGQQQQASTDAFQCGKCKQRKCTYYQMQTRSADEPMTTFVTCVFPGCGNRWKFC